ncbi:MAG: hypothetical protein ACLPRH_05550 [Syntrophobacteraceae bacterium]
MVSIKKWTNADIANPDVVYATFVFEIQVYNQIEALKHMGRSYNVSVRAAGIL